MKNTSNISTTLQFVPPEDITYSNGPVVSNNKLFRKIKVEGSAYIPQGRSVELRALEEIEMDPDFEAPTGTDFLAEIVADSGMYQYDAIGNLVLDQHEGVKIYWTPYDKVREVRAKNDSLITTFRYDGAGNRIEKRVRSLSSGEGWGEAVTHYVRDASGNVMGVYKDSLISEHHLYGSSRLGMYTGGRYNGQLSLGEKNYELSNHLGNVLTTITDNIGMIEGDSTWATVVSTRDYYPFGLEMEERTWSDTTSTYRYGFNGKEKDDNGEWGNTTYDYGFRIYDPVIARFKSVDPLTKDYPMLTPYQFASNRPIDGIDLDGLEVVLVNRDNDPTIWSAGQTLTDKSAIHIVAHGSQFGISNDVNNTKIRKKSEFMTILQMSDQYDALSKSGELTAVLHSCRTGRPRINNDGSITPSFAQTMSKELGIKVIAPDERDYFSAAGESGPFITKFTDEVNRDYLPSTTKDKYGQPTSERGNWLEYTEGVLTAVYGGGWDPVADPSWLDKLLYKKDLSFTVNVGANSQLNLRKGAGTSFDSVGKLSKGSILTPTGNVDNGWMEVTTEDKQTGWVNSDYTTPNY